MQALQFGASLLIWGVFVRTVVVWHISWSVNSLSHLWGYRNYETDEGSRNNMLVALISNGEGWHNNHHADPRSSRHGHRWFELDIVYLTIRAMASMGLARNLVPWGSCRTRIHDRRAANSGRSDHDLCRLTITRWICTGYWRFGPR